MGKKNKETPDGLHFFVSGANTYLGKNLIQVLRNDQTIDPLTNSKKIHSFIGKNIKITLIREQM